MPKFTFAKLVRDKIVDQQLASGAKPVYRKLGQKEHRQALVDKIIEEAKEIVQAPSNKVATEIADVQQAIDDLTELFGLSTADITQAQAAKNAKNGAFKQGIYVDYVEVDTTDPWATYYRQNADRYPEVS
jgi:predicted house-cleaning noncanonical NTP pyrophosphatase (MazG superfamily)